MKNRRRIRQQGCIRRPAVGKDILIGQVPSEVEGRRPVVGKDILMFKNAIWLFSLAFIVLVIFLPSYTRLQDLREKNASYQKQIEALKRKNIELTEEKERLKDPVYLERVAREKMGLIKEGEVVYQLVPAEEKK